MTDKRCTKCHEVKPLTAFSKGHAADGRQYWCRECAKEYRHTWYHERGGSIVAKAKYQRNQKQRTEQSRRRYQANPQQALDNNRKRRYGIDGAAYEQLRHRQHDQCAICCGSLRGSRNAHIDHDHETGKLRGILCRACNHMLGHAHDQTVVLASAIAYLTHGAHGWDRIGIDID